MWKSGYEEHDRSGKPEQNSWDSLERVDPLREEHLLGRTAHSARNEETIYERTGKPDSEDAQGKANFEKVHRGEVTQQNLLTKSRTKCKFDRKECQTMQKIVPNISIIWGMFMVTTLNAVTFMGKELFHDAECCAE